MQLFSPYLILKQEAHTDFVIALRSLLRAPEPWVSQSAAQMDVGH